MFENKYSGKKRGFVPVESEVIVYGTSWCGMTQMVRRYLDRLDINYRYMDLEENAEAVNQLRWITGGYTHHPTVIIDGQVLIEPDIDELQAALADTGYI